MTLIDTNVLSDLASGDATWAPWSRHQLEIAAARGPLAMNDIVFAELCAAFEDLPSIERFVSSLRLEVLRATPASLFLAAQAHRRYRRADGPRTNVLPDLFIGAHAQALGWPLITRDVRRYRTYFPTVELITP